MHPAAKRLQARLRKLSEEAGAADEFSDSEVGEARTTVGVVNVKKCLLSPSLDDQDEFECTLDWRVESGTQPSPHFLHQPTEIRTIPASSPLVLEGNGPALLSAKHGNSVVHLYKAQCEIRRERSGAVVDTGAQRGATPHSSETLASTGEILSMQPAVGVQQQMKGILMGAETVTVHGKPIILVVPDISVFSPELADPLVPAGRLMEAGFDVAFRIPKHADTDGFQDFPLYGGTIVTPDRETIVMEYDKHTWRLPMPGNSVARATTENRVETLNSFECLTDPHVDNDSNVPVSDFKQHARNEQDQRRFELMCKRQREAKIAHEAGGHCNNRATLLNLQAKEIAINHLKRYILAHKCEHCYANIGRRHYKTKSKTALGELHVSTITDPSCPGTSITESLSSLFECTAPLSCNLYPLSISDSALSNEVHAQAGDNDRKLAKDCAMKLKELKDLRRQLDKGIKENSEPVQSAVFSPPGTDLRMDWGDACSLGRLPDLNRYFLLIIDKGTEYFATFPTKTRKNPLELLKAFITTTGKTPRYLRVDGAKEFATPDIVDFCAEKGIILQLVVAYNHTMQARVEAAIGCVKQHSRIALLTCGAPTRFWADATTDFTIKKNFLWASEDQHGSLTTAHDRMRPAFAGTLATVNIPFGCRVLARIPREHRLVSNGSFGDRFVEGIYLHSDTKTPCIFIYVFSAKAKMLVQDFEFFPEDYPFRNPNCLTRRATELHAEMKRMHAEDTHDDDLIAEELALNAHTEQQQKAVTRATSQQLSGSPTASAQKDLAPNTSNTF